MNDGYILAVLCVALVTLGLYIEERWKKRASQPPDKKEN
jgi:hypothetical protein